MAKKKAKQQEKRSEKEQQVTVMEEGFEKLRSLNSMLLKETMEKRQQVLRLQSEETKLRQNLADSESRCLQGLRKEEVMDEKINELISVNIEKESRVESLIEAKATVDMELDKALKQLDEERKMTERTVAEKKEMEESKRERETEIVELHKQLAEFKDTISELEVARNAQEEKIMNMESEVGRYKAAFDQVVLDKDELQRCFDNEKQIGINMKKEIDGMEKHIQDLVKEVKQTKADYLNVIEENKDLETVCHVLNKEIGNVQASLGEAQREISSMQCKIELANSSSEEMLNALKIAADSICSNDEKQLNGEYFKPHEADLEAIKNALKSKENKVEEMKRQVDFLQLSVAQAQKKKTFWTMLSSATTLIAAVSMAYVARGGN